MKLSSLFAVSLLCASSIAGCGSDPLAEFRGVDGNARFAMTRSRGCSPQISIFTEARPGCPVNRPLLTGVNEAMSIRFDDAQGSVVVRSNAPDVVGVGEVRTSDGGRLFNVDVRAARAGTAQIEVLDGKGRRLDAVRVEVADAASMEVRADDDVQTPATLSADRTRVTLRVMQQGSLTGWVRDARGRQLLANDGVRWTVPDANTARLSWWTMGPTEVNDDRVYVTGQAVGTVELTAQAGGVRRQLTVQVTE